MKEAEGAWQLFILNKNSYVRENTSGGKESQSEGCCHALFMIAEFWLLHVRLIPFLYDDAKLQQTNVLPERLCCQGTF